MRPIPQHHVLLFEADPDDRSLADEHRRRGWPPYLVPGGVRHDYVAEAAGEYVLTASFCCEPARERALRAIRSERDSH